MPALDASELGHRERLARLYRGDIFRDAPTPASLALAGYVHARIREAFPEDDPTGLHRLLSNDVFFRRLTALRHALFDDPRLPELVREVLESWGWDLERTFCDRLRLRAVPSGGHRVAEAREAYLAHRDSWYANPPAQANVWIAVTDVAPEEAFGFHERFFDEAVPNSSAGFDYAAWNALGGWQAPDDRKHYPTALGPLPRPSLRLGVPAGGSLIFSGTHLHGTVGHDSGRTRWSMEIRTVCLDDVLPLQPARNLDNRSTGTTLRDFRRASDLAPFPEEIAAAHEAWSRSF